MVGGDRATAVRDGAGVAMEELDGSSHGVARWNRSVVADRKSVV